MGQDSTPPLKPDVNTFPTVAHEINPDLAKHTMDVQPLKDAFMSVFAGWRLQLEEKDYTSALGRKSKRNILVIHREVNRRLTNDAGADFLFSTVFPYVSPAEASTKVDADKITRGWRSMLGELKWSLMRSFLFEGNPFEIRMSAIPQIISKLTPLYLISLRAEKGWTMEKLAGSWTSSLSLTQPVNPQPQREGLGAKIAGALPKW